MYIRVRVQAGAKKENVGVLSENNFKISVREKPLQNLANRRIIELIASYFKTSIKSVHIISGHHSPSKILSVD